MSTNRFICIAPIKTEAGGSKLHIGVEVVNPESVIEKVKEEETKKMIKEVDAKPLAPTTTIYLEEHQEMELIACRICLLTKGKLYPMKKYKLQEMYIQVMGLPVDEDDGMPQYLCIECTALLEKSHQFKSKSKRSFSLLRMFAEMEPLTMLQIEKINRKNNRLQSNISMQYFPPDYYDDCMTHSYVPESLKSEPQSETKTVTELKICEKDDDLDFGFDSDNDYQPTKSPESQPEDTFIAPKVIEPVKEISPKRKSNVKKSQAKVKKRKIRKKGEDETAYLKNCFTIKILSMDEQLEVIRKRKDSESYKNFVYKCEICFKGTNMRLTHDLHMAKHSPDYGKLECTVCHLRLTDKQKLYAHLKRHERLYCCNKCPLTVYTCSDAKKHLEFHEGKTYQCHLCPEVYRTNGGYTTHMRVKHPSTQHVCSWCGYSFQSERGLRKHRLMKHMLEPQEIPLHSPFCMVCSIHFLTEEALQAHLSVSPRHNSSKNVRNEPYFSKMVHAEKARVKALQGIITKTRNRRKQIKFDEPTPCEYCGMEIDSLDTYKSHLQAQHPEASSGLKNTPIVCEICGKMLQRPSKLHIHMLEHAGTMFKCNICDKSYRSKAVLDHHRRLHSGKVYPCAACGKLFNSQGNWNKHCKKVHADNHGDVTCQFCKKTFKSKAHIAQHIEHVHLKKPWPKRDKLDQADTQIQTLH